MTTGETWVKSSYCADGMCVEVSLAEKVSIRDNKNPDSGQLVVSPEAWRNFLKMVTK